MKRKIILIVQLLLLAASMTACGAKVATTETTELTELAAEEAKEEEKALYMMEYGEKIQKMYGTEGYLGLMTDEVELLTEEEVLKIDPDSFGGENSVTLNGKFNKTPVTDINEARKVLYSVIHLFGIPLDEATFLYGAVYEGEERTTYRFVQFYKDVMVPEGYVDIIVNGNQDTENIYCYVKSEEKIGLESTEPKVKEEELVKRFEELFAGYRLENYKLCILSTVKQKLELVWVVLATPPGEEEMTVIHIDSYTGEEIVYAESKRTDEDDKEDNKEGNKEGNKEDKFQGFSSYGKVTYEQLLEWNEEGELEMLSSDGGETLSHLYGRFTEEKIETEQDAIKAVWSLAHWMGVDKMTDSFQIQAVFRDEKDTTYRLDQYYKGLEVVGGGVIIGTDAEGYGDYFSSCYQRHIDVDVEPVRDEQDLIKILLQTHKECKIESSGLVIYESEDGYGLTWRLIAKLDDVYYEVGIHDVTGEIIYKDDGEVY